MGFTLDEATDLGKLRMKISDDELETYVFEDEELAAILDEEDYDLNYAAAEALSRLILRPNQLKRMFRGSSMDGYANWASEVESRIERFTNEAERKRERAFETEVDETRAFTYDHDSDPSLSKLRDEIGDNDSSRVIFDDAELNRLLSENNGNVEWAAIDALERLTSRPTELMRMFGARNLDNLSGWTQTIETRIQRLRDRSTAVQIPSGDRQVTWTNDLSDTMDNIKNRDVSS